MGALAPAFPWIPEDDFLLKNAVEAGASFESLAKGVVQFSRRFTVRELRNRWNAILYDPVVSAKASAYFIEFERTAPSTLSKPSRFEKSKESKCVSGKRKAASVRSCYYSMRKRICNKPFDSTNLNFVVCPAHYNFSENIDEPPLENCTLGDPVSNNFGQEDSNFDFADHFFPEFGAASVAAANAGVTANVFYTGFLSPVAEDLHMACSNMHKQTPHAVEARELDAKRAFMSEQNIGNTKIVCTGFGGSEIFNSPVPDSGVSLHNLGDSSSLPPRKIWRTIEGVLTPNNGDPLSRNEQVMGNEFAFPEDGNMENTDDSGYDDHLDSTQNNQMPWNNTRNSNPTPTDYLTELSNTLLNFTTEEELLFMNADGKDGIDESYIDGFSSLLFDPPNKDMANVAATEAAASPDNYLAVFGGEQHRDSDDNGQPHHCGCYVVSSSESQVLPCESIVNLQFPELHDGVICCTLNTEDTEIPSNDDAFLPDQMLLSSLLSVKRLKFHDANNPASPVVKGFFGQQKGQAGCLSLMKREQKNPEPSCLPSQRRGSQLVQETGQSYLDHGTKFELPNIDRAHYAFRAASAVCQGPRKISAANVSTTPLPPVTLKDEATDTQQEQCLNYNADCYLEKLAPDFNGLVSYPNGNDLSNKQVDAPATIQNQPGLHPELSSIEMTVPEPVVNHSTTDQEEIPPESDGDIPQFSDVEAMILDMDLSPDNQDLYSSKEVSKYQHEENKREIVRLEQAAHSSMQRVLASQGALAVLYGRHSKFYIQKPEVLLGRATEDFDVDIDLGREGRANKISRRQAIIKMDQRGSFNLKNIGKHSIFVNNMEIAPKQSVSLTSSCLVEVRGMPFLFETNRTCVKQ